MQIWRVNATPTDFFFFVSREFNQRSEVENVIHNYAIMYALNSKQHIVAVGHEPRYDELKELDYYATPAVADYPPTKIIIQYNSINEFTGKTETTLNIPSIGRYSTILPLSTSFTFFLITKKHNWENIQKPVVRIGKKLLPLKLKVDILKISEIVLYPKYFFKADCALNLIDMSSEEDEVRQGSVTYMPPSPVILNAEIKAPHIVATLENQALRIPIPKHFRSEAHK